VKSWPELYIPKLPERFHTPALSLFDTATSSTLAVAEKNKYRIYVCGITPYDATHLGHAATYLTFDLLCRYLKATGAEVLFVQNITDIDDPLLERAARDGVDWQELAQSQIELFRSDMSALHILPPSHYVGVVEAMPLVVDAISKLHEAGATYLVDQDMYFRVKADPDYGTRSHLTDIDARKIFAERGGDPDRAGKEDPFDALVWLTSKPDQPTWQSPFGFGRPGWHIECSAIALHYLDTSQDASEFSIQLQGGGSDLIFPHHFMSAQIVKAALGRDFAESYVHAGMIGLDGEKMSKSKGNLIFVSKLIQEGVDPMVIRWALLSGHYQHDREWSTQLLEKAKDEVVLVRSALSRSDTADASSLVNNLIKDLSENLNTPKALSKIVDWSLESNKIATSNHSGLVSRTIDYLLGLAL